MVNTTNARAAAEGAGFGGTQYNDWEPFDVAEMNKMMGLLFVNGLCPRPRIKMWFEPHPIFGNNFIAGAMHKPRTGGRRALHGMRRWAQFRRFMCMFDFRQDARKETAKNPLWKVQLLLDELNKNGQKMWIPGKWVSIDEQTLGFQGCSGIKLRISYKKEGDGFQCNAVCDDGYTFSCYFRHGGIPPLSQLSSKTGTYHQQPSVLSGLLFVSRTFGLAFTWITFLTPGSYSQHCTRRNVWRMELYERPAVAFLPR